MKKFKFLVLTSLMTVLLVGCSETEKTVVQDAEKESITEEAKPEVQETKLTVSQEQAVKKAKNYIDFLSFSKKGLIDQLEFDGFTNEEAVYAVDNIGADWNEQAKLKAENYLDLFAFSRAELLEQLKFDGFTDEEANYGVSEVGL